MFIVRLMGGLGNQMFQYALGRRLAHRHDTTLKLDRSGFAADPRREYALDHLNIVATFATDAEVEYFRRVHGGLPRRLVPRPLRRWLCGRSLAYTERRAFTFDPDVLELVPPAYLDGYWQSEKYFAPIGRLLRAEFTLRTALSPADRELQKRIGVTRSIGVHVRRGDYADDPKVRSIHGLCAADYYTRAMRRLEELAPGAHAFVFSDDPGWARANLDLGVPTTVVDANAGLPAGDPADRAHIDLYLMSRCRHQVIANSSFSWWAAWLNPHADKCVIAPRRWLADPRRAQPDVLPSDWIAL